MLERTRRSARERGSGEIGELGDTIEPPSAENREISEEKAVIQKATWIQIDVGAADPFQ